VPDTHTGKRLALRYMSTRRMHAHSALCIRRGRRLALRCMSIRPINALLIGAYRLRRRGVHTAGTVGFVIAGSAATSAVFTSCLISPGTAIGMLTPISRPIALASFHALARLFGNAAWPNHGLEWTYVVIFAVLIPIAFFCIPPLLVAIIGGRVARYLDATGLSLPGAPRHGAEREV
jgi:hypothetical protein